MGIDSLSLRVRWHTLLLAGVTKIPIRNGTTVFRLYVSDSYFVHATLLCQTRNTTSFTPRAERPPSIARSSADAVVLGGKQHKRPRHDAHFNPRGPFDPPPPPPTNLLDETAEQRLDDAVHSPQKDAALSVDVAAVLVGERGWEGEGGAEGDRPAQRDVRGLSVNVLHVATDHQPGQMKQQQSSSGMDERIATVVITSVMWATPPTHAGVHACSVLCRLCSGIVWV